MRFGTCFFLWHGDRRTKAWALSKDDVEGAWETNSAKTKTLLDGVRCQDDNGIPMEDLWFEV